MWLSGVALALPEGRRFWRQHRRVRLLAEQTVERDGRGVAIVGLEAVESGARFEVAAEIATLAVRNVPGRQRRTARVTRQFDGPALYPRGRPPRTGLAGSSAAGREGGDPRFRGGGIPTPLLPGQRRRAAVAPACL